MSTAMSVGFTGHQVSLIFRRYVLDDQDIHR